MWKRTVKQLENSIGVPADTIRYYREYGILNPVVRENGYHEYSVEDMIKILLTKEMRSMDISLKEVKDFFERETMYGYTGWLEQREQVLQERIRILQLEIQRLEETRVYASCGVRILNQVEEFDGPATWAVSCAGPGGSNAQGQVLKQWVQHFPFTYVSATISLMDLLETPAGTAYPIHVGTGALDKYIDIFSLPLPEGSFYQPGGHFIRTCIKTKDIFGVRPEDLKPLFDYARKNRLRFDSCTGGRILFAEENDEAEYYLLVWVKVAYESQ